MRDNKKMQADAYVLLVRGDDDRDGAGRAPCERAGLPCREAGADEAARAATELAKQSPRSMLLVVGAGDTLVLRGGAALRAAFAAAGGKPGCVVVGGLPPLGLVADAALSGAARSQLFGPGEGRPARRGARRLPHPDGGVVLGLAPDVANLVAHAARQVTEGAAPDLPAAVAAYAASGQWRPGNRVLPRAAVDHGEHVSCATLAPADDLIVVVDASGSPTVRARAAETRPCVVRAPFGGGLDAVARAASLPPPGDQDGGGDPRVAATKAALWRLWCTHQVEAAAAALLVAALLVACCGAVVRWVGRPAAGPAAGSRAGVAGTEGA